MYRPPGSSARQAPQPTQRTSAGATATTGAHTAASLQLQGKPQMLPTLNHEVSRPDLQGKPQMLPTLNHEVTSPDLGLKVRAVPAAAAAVAA